MSEWVIKRNNMNCKLRDGKEYPEHLARVVIIYNFATNDFEDFIECTRCGKRTDSKITSEPDAIYIKTRRQQALDELNKL